MHILECIDAPVAAPLYKRFRSAVGEHLLVLRHTRLFDLPPEVAADLEDRPDEMMRLVTQLGQTGPGEAALDLAVAPTPQSLSLNVSAACNLSCAYCYADRGGFGGKQITPMNQATAFEAVESLLAMADPAQPITIGFLGGEPLLNRKLVHAVVAHASALGEARDLDVRFSMTTNGTLLNQADLELMRRNRFAVTVSVDGDVATQNAQRPHPRGHDSFSHLAARIAPLLETPGRAQVAARMTVGAGRFNLVERLEAVWALGFSEAGVAPLRTAADGSAIEGSAWLTYTDELRSVAVRELKRAHCGQSIRLTNLAVALKQIHVGASSPYPCGAGGGYFSVGTDGRWYACHRAIGNESFFLGDARGLSTERRKIFLAQRHVHAQTACSSCWARYLCSGGCHQEAAARSAPSCDFIRHWLEFCLTAYCELLAARPDYFSLSPNVTRTI